MLLLTNQPDYKPQPLILPGDPEFHLTLGTVKPPVEDQSANFVFRAGSLVMEAVTNDRDLDEYLEGGEYDEVMGDELESDILWLPCSMSIV